MAAQCEMVVGFLVPHRCDNPALGTCRQCGRGFCEEHLEITPEGMICTACRQGLDQPVALPATAQSYDAGDILIFSAATRWDDDSDRADDAFADLS